MADNQVVDKQEVKKEKPIIVKNVWDPELVQIWKDECSKAVVAGSKEQENEFISAMKDWFTGRGAQSQDIDDFEDMLRAHFNFERMINVSILESASKFIREIQTVSENSFYLAVEKYAKQLRDTNTAMIERQFIKNLDA
jgi:hypothetical protein